MQAGLMAYISDKVQSIDLNVYDSGYGESAIETSRGIGDCDNLRCSRTASVLGSVQIQNPRVESISPTSSPLNLADIFED